MKIDPEIPNDEASKIIDAAELRPMTPNQIAQSKARIAHAERTFERLLFCLSVLLACAVASLLSLLCLGIAAMVGVLGDHAFLVLATGFALIGTAALIWAWFIADRT
jgi:hypothetical protein